MLNNNEQIVKDTLFAEGFTKEAAAAVMGVVGGESGFQTLKEASYRNTDNARIRAIFPVRLGSMTDANLNTLKQSDANFFDAVYGGMYGNTAPGDGWKYVGRGFNGITFKANYQQAAAGTGLDLVNRPELLEQPGPAAKALAYYFRSIKTLTDFNKAFEEAYRLNAGAGRSFSFYASSTNPVHKTGIPLKRSKAQQYYNTIGGPAALFFFHIVSSSGDILYSKTFKEEPGKDSIKNIISQIEKIK